jgi:hypothetical protein
MAVLSNWDFRAGPECRGRGKGVENRYSLAIDLGTVIENLPKSNDSGKLRTSCARFSDGSIV